MRIGIDLGGTKIAAAIVDDNYNIVVKKQLSTKKERHHSEIIRDIGKLAIELIDTIGLNIDSIQSIGIGSPGTLDRESGFVLYSNNLAWRQVNLRGEIAQYIDKPIYIDNDANCAAFGELLAGAAEGYDSVVMITLGTGVGGGIVLNKKIYAGFNGAANTIGHTTLISRGKQCNCGRRGCWEAYASVSALINMANRIADKEKSSLLNDFRDRDGELSGKNIFEAAKVGDVSTKKLLEQYFFYVAEGITNMINILQPEAIIVGGGISKEGEFLLGPIKQHIFRDVYCKDIIQPCIKPALLGNDAGIIGAAFLGNH